MSNNQTMMACIWLFVFFWSNKIKPTVYLSKTFVKLIFIEFFFVVPVVFFFSFVLDYNTRQQKQYMNCQLKGFLSRFLGFFFLLTCIFILFYNMYFFFLLTCISNFFGQFYNFHEAIKLKGQKGDKTKILWIIVTKLTNVKTLNRMNISMSGFFFLSIFFFYLLSLCHLVHM